MKTELEEAAEKSAIEQMEAGNSAYILGFKQGAKWQQERMHSELELFLNELIDRIDSFEYSVNQQSYLSKNITEWFEQFKKK